MFARFILALSAAVVLAVGAQAQGGKTFPHTKPKPIFVPPAHKVPVYKPPFYRPPIFYPPVYKPPVFYPPYFGYYPKAPWWYGW